MEDSLVQEEPMGDGRDNGKGTSEASSAQDFDYRDSDVPMAVWAPMLTTDAYGNVSYTFHSA